MLPTFSFIGVNSYTSHSLGYYPEIGSFTPHLNALTSTHFLCPQPQSSPLDSAHLLCVNLQNTSFLKKCTLLQDLSAIHCRQNSHLTFLVWCSKPLLTKFTSLSSTTSQDSLRAPVLHPGDLAHTFLFALWSMVFIYPNPCYCSEVMLRADCRHWSHQPDSLNSPLCVHCLISGETLILVDEIAYVRWEGWSRHSVTSSSFSFGSSVQVWPLSWSFATHIDFFSSS